MNFSQCRIPNIYDGMVHTINASILVRKHNTNELSYYIENDDDTLEVVYRERNGCDGVLCGTIMKPYTWEYEKPYEVLVGEEKNYQDPRLWLYNKKPYISYTYYPVILFGEYDNNLKILLYNIQLPIGRNHKDGLEKNWGFFQHEERLCIVYYPNPLIIIEIEIKDNNFQIVNISEEMCNPLGIGICGGSPPVLHPIEKIYYIFVHKTIIQYNYNIWCVAFTKVDDNKWKIKGFTQERLNDNDITQISFAEGAIYDKEKEQWIVSGGYKDHVLGFWTISHEDLISRMTWLF
jgi:hypothetical protein